LSPKNAITGRAYVLGDNVDTDQIIPAQYLTFNPSIPEEFRMFGKYALSGVPPAQAGLPKGHVPFHTDNEFVSPYKIIVAGKNFGCGSSREHAPIALDAAGIEAVVAEFYARIFFRNAVNGGYLIPFECADRLCERVCTGDELRLDFAEHVLANLTTSERWPLKPLGEVAPIVEAGGLFAYARKTGMLKA
jgi:3-isopropylmalate/(R)-2-methylmalate dehydratase small subunit